MKYVCELCGMIYDEAAGYPVRGIVPGTPFAELPEDFACPGCGSEKEAFTVGGQRQSLPAERDSRFWSGIKYSDPGGESDR